MFVVDQAEILHEKVEWMEATQINVQSAHLEAILLFLILLIFQEHALLKVNNLCNKF